MEVEARTEILTEELPIVIVRVVGSPSKAQFEAHLARMHALYSTHKNIGVIFDGREAKYMSSENRILQGQWLKTHHDLVAGSLHCAAYVAPNLMGEIILKGIFLLQQPSWPNKIFSSFAKAKEWTAKQLEELNS